MLMLLRSLIIWVNKMLYGEVKWNILGITINNFVTTRVLKLLVSRILLFKIISQWLIWSITIYNFVMTRKLNLLVSRNSSIQD